MQGKRVDANPGEEGQYPFPKLKPGEYGKGIDGIWYCCAPRDTGDGFTNFHGNLDAHKIIEHEDGTITVFPSILIKRHDGEWHGFLEKGIWREC